MFEMAVSLKNKKGFFYMKKKTLLLIFSVALVGSLLGGCSGKEDYVAPTVTDISEGEYTEEETEEPE